MTGAGVTTGYAPAPIVYAGNAPYNDHLCQSSTPGTFQRVSPVPLPAIFLTAATSS